MRLTASVCRRGDKKRVSPVFCQANLLRGRLSILRNDPWTDDKLTKPGDIINSQHTLN